MLFSTVDSQPCPIWGSVMTPGAREVRGLIREMLVFLVVNLVCFPVGIRSGILFEAGVGSNTVWGGPGRMFPWRPVAVLGWLVCCRVLWPSGRSCSEKPLGVYIYIYESCILLEDMPVVEGCHSH